jgi:hypothetical protein
LDYNTVTRRKKQNKCFAQSRQTSNGKSEHKHQNTSTIKQHTLSYKIKQHISLQSSKYQNTSTIKHQNASMIKQPFLSLHIHNHTIHSLLLFLFSLQCRQFFWRDGGAGGERRHAHEPLGTAPVKRTVTSTQQVRTNTAFVWFVTRKVCVRGMEREGDVSCFGMRVAVHSRAAHHSTNTNTGSHSNVAKIRDT